jgi:stage II sporulation protein AB (anti-sigma F factor)
VAEAAAAPAPPDWARGPHTLHLDVPATAPFVAVCRTAVAALAAELDFTLPEVEEVRVLVSEAVSNAVLHAYPEGGPGRIDLWARVEGGELAVCVLDRGRGIADLPQARRAGQSGDGERLGLGFAFLEALADRLEVQTAPDRGTAVTWAKRPAARSPAAAGTAGLG